LLVAAVGVIVLGLLALTPRAPASPHRARRAPAYCTAKSHPRGCIKVPKAARRPKHASEQGSASDAPKGAVDAAGIGAGPGVRNSAAVAWAKSEAGNPRWNFYCELFVEEAYGTSGQFQSAAVAAKQMSLHKGSITSAPVGALVYFAPNSVNPYGHVGLSIGGGKMISALDKVQITNVPKDRYWSSLYIGWAQAPAKWPGRIPPAPGSTLPLDQSAIQITAPAFGSVQGGLVPLAAESSNVSGVVFYAYYATDPNDIRTLGWRPIGTATRVGDTWTLPWTTASVPTQGNPAWGTVAIAAIATGPHGELTGTRDSRRISIDNSGGALTPTTTPTVPTTPTTPSTTPSVPTTFKETTGGVAHTWSDYTTAGGTPGPVLAGQQTVDVVCKVAGFRVQDGNTWWYRLLSGPGETVFYVSADAFYNNGATSGSLIGTPFVDPAVGPC
jgi:hypothetical protein